MNKLKSAGCLLFGAACCLCVLTDLIFPYFMHFIQGLIIIGAIGLVWTAMLDLHRFFKSYNRLERETVYNLIFRSGWRSAIVNILTVYRIIITPLLLVLLFQDHPAFKWFLLSAFVTDALDGELARRFKVTTKLGAKMDSLADDILFIVAVVSIIYLYPWLIIENGYIILSIIVIFLLKMIFLYVKHNKIISGMHTYLTKAAALVQALFFLHCIFYGPNNTIFYVMAVTTIVAIAEEIIIILCFRELKPNMKGLLFINSKM